ncbi:MAG: stage III sporulation protein AF [Eubacteriales bacterium]|nr:stage III sporulation protein AF [Eubacteriales bacterium]
MTVFYGWLKNIICCICLMELLCHIVPGESYRKYLKFFCGLVFLLTVMEPVLSVTKLQKPLEETLREFSIREQVQSMEEAKQSLEGLQSRSIEEAYVGELERQMTELAKSCGAKPLWTKVTVEDSQGDIRLKNVIMRVQGEAFAKETIIQQISTLYGVKQEQVLITSDGAVKNG